MISIIICSRHKEKDPFLVNNIADTIGHIPYEIIWVDNSRNEYSIFQAYTEGVHKAQYEFLCFMHDDIIYHTDDWGNIAINQMEQNPKIGMLGVIGGRYVNHISRSWGTFNSSRIRRGCYIQHIEKSSGEIKNIEFDYHNPADAEVAAIDGMWMFIRRNLFASEVAWDCKSYSGFHFYDMDMSMCVKNAGYRIEVAPIMIEHKSTGIHNLAFWSDYVIFYNKWKDYLPVGTSTLTQEDIKECEKLAVEVIAADQIRSIKRSSEVIGSTDYKIGHSLLSPIRRIKRIFKKILAF